MNYEEFLESKKKLILPTGKIVKPESVHKMLFEFQRDIVVWAVKRGRCAVFADTGLGKTFIQIEWARLLGGDTLIVAPLSVARQTIREAKKIGVTVTYARKDAELVSGINITNYENIDNIERSDFNCVVLDELKESYFQIAVKNLLEAERVFTEKTLFDVQLPAESFMEPGRLD